MRVFTTIYLAQSLPANVPCVDQHGELDQDLDGLAEFKQAPRERIALLEARNWLEDDGFDEK